MKNVASSDYQIAPAQGRIEKLLAGQRRKMFDAFMEFKRGSDNDTVLNVGMIPDSHAGNEDYLMAWATPQQRSRILSYEIECTQREPRISGVANRQNAGIHLPFADKAFDWVFCDEVIEHINSAEQQFLLIQELTRVARKGVFLTTQNRRHPIEFHTALPFVHWVPASWGRRIVKWLGKSPAASAYPINLLDSQALYQMARQLPDQPKNDVGHKRVFGIKAHFFLMIEKSRA